MDKPVGPRLAAVAAATAIAATLFAARRQSVADDWSRTLDEALPAIVVIKMNYVKPFDGESVSLWVLYFIE